jgi:hypothetical protein
VAVIPGGIGLLYMARGLAMERCGSPIEPLRKYEGYICYGTATCEFYAILDRISAGQKP